MRGAVISRIRAARQRCHILLLFIIPRFPYVSCYTTQHYLFPPFHLKFAASGHKSVAMIAGGADFSFAYLNFTVIEILFYDFFPVFMDMKKFIVAKSGCLYVYDLCDTKKIRNLRGH